MLWGWMLPILQKNKACEMLAKKADGLTKVLAGASMKTFVSDLGLASLTR